MANNFTSLWNMCFSWLVSLLNLKLPYFLGSTSISYLDIIIGTLCIFASFGFIRGLLHSGFSIAGKDINSAYHHQKNIKALNNQTHTEYLNRQQGITYIDKLKSEGKL